MEFPYLEKLVKRLAFDDPEVRVEFGSNGDATLTWYPPGERAPVTLRTRENELATAITFLGRDCRDALWPTSTIEDAGFNILMVHLDEAVATRKTSKPLKVGDRGLIWPKGE